MRETPMSTRRLTATRLGSARLVAVWEDTHGQWDLALVDL